MYLHQFNHLEFRKGVLPWIYIMQGPKYHQLILPAAYRAHVLQLLHDEQSHQRTEHTMALIKERFIWSTLCQDFNNWVKTCKRCKKAKGSYNDSNVIQGSLIANHLLEIFCLDFTTMDHSKDGKENVLVMMDAFSNFTVAVVTPNQHAKTVAKALLNRWFYSYGIPSRIHSDQGKSFDNDIIHHLCTIYGLNNQQQHHIIPVIILNVRGLIEHYMTCLKWCLSHKNPIGLHI